MNELLSRFGPDELIGLTAVVGGLLCGALAIVMGVGFAIRRAELAASLKRSMIERGMSAEEICQVIGAGCSSKALKQGKQAAYREL